MRKYLVTILTIMMVLLTNPVYAVTNNNLAKRATIETVSLLAPPNGLTPAKGDGTDESKVIQAIFDYATTAKKTILIPKDYTFVVDNLVISKADHFSILGYGTLKHKDQAKNGILSIEDCSNFQINTLTTDGNVEGNKTDGERVNQYLHSLEIYDSHDFTIDTFSDKNPAGDSLYLNNVNNVKIGTIKASADTFSGRNALSIVKAQNVTVDNVNAQNIGVPSMPGGIDLEPNNSTDNIGDVTIKSATISTSGHGGCNVANWAGADVKNILINATVTRVANSEAYISNIVKVNNIKGNIKLNYYKDGTEACKGAIISACNNVDMNIEISNTKRGLSLGSLSTHLNLKGNILGTPLDGKEITKVTNDYWIRWS